MLQLSSLLDCNDIEAPTRFLKPVKQDTQGHPADNFVPKLEVVLFYCIKKGHQKESTLQERKAAAKT